MTLEATLVAEEKLSKLAGRKTARGRFTITTDLNSRSRNKQSGRED